MYANNKLTKATTLLEAIIAATVISVGIVSVFRAFTVSLSAMRLSQDITSASFLFKEKLWDMEQRWKLHNLPRSFQEKVRIRNKEFTTNYDISDTGSSTLKKLTYTISWEKGRNAPYSMQFYVYLPSAD